MMMMMMMTVTVTIAVMMVMMMVATTEAKRESVWPIETEVSASVRPPTWGVLQTVGEDQVEALRVKARETADFIVRVRRELHQVPELLYELNETTTIVARILTELKIKFVGGVGRTGIVASIGTGAAPVVALRTDMDGLPIVEAVESEFKSRHAGRMHACGHDAHMAMLLGAAKILKGVEEQLPGTVMLIFQPAEEGGAGALAMIQDGLFTGASRFGPAPGRVFGMHVWPTLPSGVVASRAGVLMASAGFFDIVIVGRGGHAAMPHQTVDPVTIAALAVVSVQTIISRELSPLDSGVVSITKISGGDAFNVIPGNATIGGTIRSFSQEGYMRLQQRLIDIVSGVAHTHGATAVVRQMSTLDETTCLPSSCAFPPLNNNKEVHEFAMKQAALLVGADKTIADVEPSMTGEDFAYYAREIPSSFVWLGSGDNNSTGLHTPTFTLDERVLPVGSALHVAFALNTLFEASEPLQQIAPGDKYIAA